MMRYLRPALPFRFRVAQWLGVALWVLLGYLAIENYLRALHEGHWVWVFVDAAVVGGDVYFILRSLGVTRYPFGPEPYAVIPHAGEIHVVPCDGGEHFIGPDCACKCKPRRRWFRKHVIVHRPDKKRS